MTYAWGRESNPLFHWFKEFRYKEISKAIARIRGGKVGRLFDSNTII
jgi:hypothetical protein